MIFDAHHYIPVLKIKRGEKKALEAISYSLLSKITPLLEIVERKDDKPLEDHLNTAFRDLVSAIDRYNRCFLDLREIEGDGPSASIAAFKRAAQEGIIFTPVTGLSRSADIDAALDNKNNGIALRFTREELEEGFIRRDLRSFIELHHLSHAEVDIIVDLGPVNELVQAGVSRLASAFLAEIPDQDLWRTMTISACAFPISMGVVDRNSYSLVERSDWEVWQNDFHANRQHIARLPTFSDCAIQHTTGVEGFDFRTMTTSASVRYTLPGDWLLIKGESTKRNLPSQQFPSLANQLVYGHLSEHYAGPNHCVGCELMKDAADGFPGLGSAEVWRRLGTIHHITTVMENLGSLTWP